jgi:hypothetical protein
MTKTPITVTLAQIAALRPCGDRWRAALAHIGMTPEDFDPERAVSIGDVAITCGLDDALHLLQLLEPRTQTLCVWPSVLRAAAYTTDHRVHDCNAVTQRWLDGDDNADRAAAGAAAWAARAAAWDAAWDADRAAAGAAAWAARAAAWDAAWAARAAAWDAAWAAAWDAAGDAAWAAAWAAARARQLTDLLAVVGSTISPDGAP